MNPARPASRRRLGLPVLVSVLTLSAAAGCSSAKLARVQPWQRETVAGPTMNPDRDPLRAAMSEHIYFSREASSGGRGVGGSGCGCN